MYIMPRISASDSPYLRSNNTGLGNVLFQIASCYGISKKTGRTPVWNNLVKFTDDLYTTFQLNHKNTIYRNFTKMIEATFTEWNDRYNHYYDPELISTIENNTNNYMLVGHFECVTYFNDYKQEIIELFSPDEVSMAEIQNKYPILFNNTYTTVSIHFRGNEYNTDFDYDFYKRAVSYMKEKIENPMFIIFSDDMDHINFNFLDNSNYIKIPMHKEDYIDLWCISLCKHNINSFSTFSFWGAYLNQNPNPIILYNHNHHRTRSFQTIFHPI